jgi:hypothetical protein
MSAAFLILYFAQKVQIRYSNQSYTFIFRTKMATIVKTESGTWKAVVRRTGWPTASKTFRIKRDAEDWEGALRMKWCEVFSSSVHFPRKCQSLMLLIDTTEKLFQPKKYHSNP